MQTFRNASITRIIVLTCSTKSPLKRRRNKSDSEISPAMRQSGCFHRCKTASKRASYTHGVVSHTDRWLLHGHSSFSILLQCK